MIILLVIITIGSQALKHCWVWIKVGLRVYWKGISHRQYHRLLLWPSSIGTLFFVRYDVIKTQIFVAIAHRTFQVTSVDKCKPSITGRHPSDHRPRYSSFINLVNLSLSRLQTETSSLPRPRDIVTLCAHATRHRNPYHVTCHRISYSHLSLKGLIALHSRFH